MGPRCGIAGCCVELRRKSSENPSHAYCLANDQRVGMNPDRRVHDSDRWHSPSTCSGSCQPSNDLWSDRNETHQSDFVIVRWWDSSASDRGLGTDTGKGLGRDTGTDRATAYDDGAGTIAQVAPSDLLQTNQNRGQIKGLGKTYKTPAGSGFNGCNERPLLSERTSKKRGRIWP